MISLSPLLFSRGSSKFMWPIVLFLLMTDRELTRTSYTGSLPLYSKNCPLISARSHLPFIRASKASLSFKLSFSSNLGMWLYFEIISRMHQAYIFHGSFPLSACFSSIKAFGVKSGKILILVQLIDRLDNRSSKRLGTSILSTVGETYPLDLEKKHGVMVLIA